MADFSEAFAGFDTSKLRHAAAIADNGRTGEVRFLGGIENTAAATHPGAVRPLPSTPLAA